MFTGIIEAIGTIESVNGHRISVRTPWNPKNITLGQSIAVQGCCLTVVDVQNDCLAFDLSDETLNKTTFGQFQPKATVNLERGMEMGQRVDGHWVTGHVDTTAVIKKIIPTADQSSTTFEIGGLKSYNNYFIPKGSIAIDGVSLTVNEVTDDGVTVCIIPYTMSHTIFSRLKVNDHVHVEFDMIGKYLARYFENFKTQLGNYAGKN